MPLFQKTIIKKYTQDLNSQKVQDAYTLFQAYFLNPTIQENIREAKEEQFQEGFLRELFDNVLGYTLNPNPNFNLTTELKNSSNSKKVDGAILIDNKAIAVIELKGTDTTDLAKIETQAFGYKNNQQHCTYVITSNFEKLRFYIDNAIEFIEFNLFTLNREDFNLLWLCLSLKSIEQNIPKKIKEESLSQEDVITKKLYNDYSLFKRELHQNLVALNPKYKPLELFKKSQKLLDRFLFLFFAEDRQLLPPNSVRLILNDWKDLQERDEDIPLYNRFKKYFEYLNTGYKGKRYDVFAYNGGLFKPDEILDAVKINDDLLFRHTLKLSEYDFVSEVDVNILGHIFENSLNELDSLTLTLSKGEGISTDAGLGGTSKRKKDGIFYTPKYITKYIVENTVGKLCNEKKAELTINEEDYITNKKRQKKTTQALADKLTEYRNWLLQITICDPACGSGAFLNQALDFLITEHRYIDELQAKLFGDAMVLSDIENSILENNLFGVDLNEESVEIAKLSLWLRTAQPNRKLNDLSNNIKCGNSLIDDPKVAGEKAFDWYAEFPKVFPRYRNKKKEEVVIEVKKRTDGDSLGSYENDSYGLFNEFHEPAPYSYSSNSKGFEKHGFDVVIGNPPYGAYLDETSKEFLSKRFQTFQGNFEIYFFFIEQLNSLLKDFGRIGFITPDTWIKIPQAQKLRKYVLNHYGLNKIVAFKHAVFTDASVNAIIFILTKAERSKECEIIKIEVPANEMFADQSRVDFCSVTNWEKSGDNQFQIWQDKSDILLIQKIEKKAKKGIDFLDICQGLVPYSNENLTPEEVKQRIHHSVKILNNEYGIWIQGRAIKRYGINVNSNEYLHYGEWLHRSRKPKYFNGKRILIQEITGGNPPRISAVIYEENLYHDPGIISCLNISHLSTEYLLAIINSKIISWYNLKTAPKGKRSTFPKILIGDIRKFPIKNIEPKAEQPFIEKADSMLSLNKELQEVSQRFQRTLQRKFALEELPKKLQDWYLLSYAEFIKELGKKQIKLSLSEEAEWEDYFLQESKKAQALKSKIDATDKEIDQIVYALYDLTEEEIKIVEGK